MDTMIYQQDGKTPHCSNASVEFLHCYFLGERLTSRHTDYPWSFGLHILQTPLGLLLVGAPKRQGLF